jgi:hypothetical protein
MRKMLMAAAMMVGFAAFAAPPAHADSFSFSFNTGDVAFAYTDGYWDHAHVWHEWAGPREVEEFRVRYADRYHDWDHHRDRDEGWHAPRGHAYGHEKHHHHDDD